MGSGQLKMTVFLPSVTNSRAVTLFLLLKMRTITHDGGRACGINLRACNLSLWMLYLETVKETMPMCMRLYQQKTPEKEEYHMDGRLISLAKFICSVDWDDETHVENEDFILNQFQGTAFSSSYKCVKVTTKGAPLEYKDCVFPLSFVAKVTSETEYQTMLKMKEQDISVPTIYGAVSCGEITVLYEELVPGHEIYKDENKCNWAAVATMLTRVHSIVARFRSEKTFQRIAKAGQVCSKDPELRTAYQRAIMNLKKQKLVLVHGDMFPTNVLVQGDGKIVLIDWADAGSAPYVNDLGRLTAIIDRDTLTPFCPCEDAVKDAYYECIKDRISYKEYVQDFYSGQFVELAANYSPGIERSLLATQEEKQFMSAIADRLRIIATKLK